MVIFSFIMNIDFNLNRKGIKMKHGIKKYLSCIILIVICLACAVVFFVQASDIWGSSSPDEGSTDTPVIDTNVSSDEISEAKINDSGTILSESLCDTTLRCEWATLKNDGDDTLYLSVELYLDTKDTITTSKRGHLTVNDVKKEFSTETLIGESNLIATQTQAIEATGDVNITISAELEIDIKEENGLSLSKIELYGTVNASEKYNEMEKKHLIELLNISQFPELPSGDEITSLAMVLAHLGYKVDKCDLCDLYLLKGPVGYTDFNEANVGNPKDAYNSYGCLPPVIINSASKFISVNGGSHTVFNYSGKSLNELYYEVSQGNPVIVWTCEDFDITPSVSRIWIVDGHELYLKSNMATVVLIGYDFENRTVTLSSPIIGEFEIDMDLFELRYLQIGAYSVVIK